MSDRVFWALILSLLLLSMLIWPALDGIRDWIADRRRFDVEDLAEDHECLQRLEHWFAARGVEATASTVPPLIWNPWTCSVNCEHGDRVWLEPTSDQIVAWATRSAS